jgi:hypothetical protein
MASSDIGDAGLCAIGNEAVTPTRMTWKPSPLIDRLRPSSPMETHLSHNNLELHDLPAFLGLVHLCGKPERRALAEGNRDHPQLAQNSYFETQISIN